MNGERLIVHDLPPGDRLKLLHAAVEDGTAGGRIYDAHTAEVARSAGATVIVTIAAIFWVPYGTAFGSRRPSST